ncbi:hypothetical protein Riv7116_2118 [Rivularia sp. PCC 7116]|nr:hypothetical protein Riv7116_2118 [Rivularia sp. PCC 7116]
MNPRIKVLRPKSNVNLLTSFLGQRDFYQFLRMATSQSNLQELRSWFYPCLPRIALTYLICAHSFLRLIFFTHQSVQWLYVYVIIVIGRTKE